MTTTSLQFSLFDSKQSDIDLPVASGRFKNAPRLGGLCKRGHDYNGTGRSLRYVRGNGRVADCVKCSPQANKVRYYGNREQCLQWMAEYRKTHQEDIKRRSREYYEANKERITARVREYDKKNRHIVQPKRSAYYRKHIERFTEYHAAYRDKHRERINAYLREIGSTPKRRMQMRAKNLKRRSAVGCATYKQIQARIEMFGERCWICHANYEAVDHVKPLAVNGTNWAANLRPICKPCNDRKNKRWFGQENLEELVAYVLRGKRKKAA